MNTLALIQKRLQTQHKVEDYNRSIAYRGVAHNRSIAYRGVNYKPGSGDSTETHGTFVYRGRTYTK